MAPIFFLPFPPRSAGGFSAPAEDDFEDIYVDQQRYGF